MLKTQIQGNLVFEPEIKEVRSSGEKEEHKKKVCILTVASNRPGRKLRAYCVSKFGARRQRVVKSISPKAREFAPPEILTSTFMKRTESVVLP